MSFISENNIWKKLPVTEDNKLSRNGLAYHSMCSIFNDNKQLNSDSFSRGVS